MARKLLNVAVLVSAFAISAEAQTLRRDQGPVNFPPASFKGTQFVDNEGCVYIRAGFEGAVNWVPRVTRGRRLICGQKPTFAARAAPAQAPRATPAQPPRETARSSAPAVPVRARAKDPIPTVASAMDSKPAAAPKPTTGLFSLFRRRTPSPAPAPTVVTATPTVTVAPKPVAAPAPKAPAVAQVQVSSGGCPGRSAISAQYTNKKGVRCGPQLESPVGLGPSIQPTQTASASGSSSGAAILRIEGAPAKVPDGYRPVYADGRYNEQRGLPASATAQSQQRAAVAWTAATPRRLIDLRTGADVTADYPYLRYPNTRLRASDVNRPAGAFVRSVIVVPRGSTQSVSSKTAPSARALTETPSKVAAPAPTTVAVAPRAVAPKVAVPAPSGGAGYRFVQAGAFGVPQNAINTANRLRGLGLPVTTQSITRSGRALTVVLAGPFQDGGSSARALSAVRAAGFRDAFPRR